MVCAHYIVRTDHSNTCLSLAVRVLKTQPSRSFMRPAGSVLQAASRPLAAPVRHRPAEPKHFGIQVKCDGGHRCGIQLQHQFPRAEEGKFYTGGFAC